jgi:hypothetical protein
MQNLYVWQPAFITASGSFTRGQYGSLWWARIDRERTVHCDGQPQSTVGPWVDWAERFYLGQNGSNDTHVLVGVVRLSDLLANQVTDGDDDEGEYSEAETVAFFRLWNRSPNAGRFVLGAETL